VYFTSTPALGPQGVFPLTVKWPDGEGDLFPLSKADSTAVQPLSQCVYLYFYSPIVFLVKNEWSCTSSRHIFFLVKNDGPTPPLAYFFFFAFTGANVPYLTYLNVYLMTLAMYQLMYDWCMINLNGFEIKHLWHNWDDFYCHVYVFLLCVYVSSSCLLALFGYPD
jgi:hypothetical protein